MAHVGNGCTDLILISKCSRWKYLKYLYRLAMSNKSPVSAELQTSDGSINNNFFYFFSLTLTLLTYIAFVNLSSTQSLSHTNEKATTLKKKLIVTFLMHSPRQRASKGRAIRLVRARWVSPWGPPLPPLLLTPPSPARNVDLVATHWAAVSGTATVRSSTRRPFTLKCTANWWPFSAPVVRFTSCSQIDPLRSDFSNWWRTGCYSESTI